MNRIVRILDGEQQDKTSFVSCCLSTTGRPRQLHLDIANLTNCAHLHLSFPPNQKADQIYSRPDKKGSSLKVRGS